MAGRRGCYRETQIVMSARSSPSRMFAVSSAETPGSMGSVITMTLPPPHTRQDSDKGSVPDSTSHLTQVIDGLCRSTYDDIKEKALATLCHLPAALIIGVDHVGKPRRSRWNPARVRQELQDDIRTRIRLYAAGDRCTVCAHSLLAWPSLGLAPDGGVVGGCA